LGNNALDRKSSFGKGGDFVVAEMLLAAVPPSLPDSQITKPT
jgi:hypothetical protein